MKKKKILRNSTIILSIIILLINICLYVKLRQTSSELLLSKDSYESAGLLVSTIFQYGTLIYGLGLILIVWIEYFLIFLLIKSYNKFDGLKRLLLLLILLFAIIILLILIIKIATLILTILF